MQNHQTVEARQTRADGRYRHRTAWVLLGAMIPALVGAQSSTGPLPLPTPIVTVMKSAQYSIFAGHVMVLRITDVGALDAATEVTLELRDAADQRRAFKSAVLRGRASVELSFRVPAGSTRQMLRGIVKLTPIAHSELSEPVAILEDLDPDSFTIWSKPPCTLAIDQPEYGSGPEGDCDGGWRVNRLTLDQANAQD